MPSKLPPREREDGGSKTKKKILAAKSMSVCNPFSGRLDSHSRAFRLANEKYTPLWGLELEIYLSSEKGGGMCRK